MSDFGSNIKPPSILYRLLSLILLPFWLIHGFIHGIRYKQTSYLIRRLSFFQNSNTVPLIWIHAASVGEVNLVKPMCHAYLNKGHSVMLTTLTSNGFQHAQKSFDSRVVINLIPIDFAPICTLFLSQFKIKLALIAETEIWPEILYQTAKKGVPLIHINARLSSKTLDKPQWVKSLLGQTLQYFHHHFVRYESDLQNFKQLAVIDSKLSVIGNLKYAQDLNTNTKPFPMISGDYILLASSHDDEESKIIELKLKNPNWPLLVIAPRHPNRAAEIISKLKAHKLNYCQRTKQHTTNKQTQVYLADTIGEMQSLFPSAKIVIMGGSFNLIGGHNLIEPAALACCIITGPSDFNIKQDIEALSKACAVIQVQGFNALETSINNLLNDPLERKKMGDNAKAFINSQQQILNQYLDKLNAYLE